MPYRTSHEFYFLGVTFIISSIAGLAAMMRSERNVTKKLVFVAMLTSGLFGLGICSWIYADLEPMQLISVSIFAGLGGMSLLDIAIQKIKNKIKQ